MIKIEITDGTRGERIIVEHGTAFEFGRKLLQKGWHLTKVTYPDNRTEFLAESIRLFSIQSVMVIADAVIRDYYQGK